MRAERGVDKAGAGGKKVSVCSFYCQLCMRARVCVLVLPDVIPWVILVTPCVSLHILFRLVYRLGLLSSPVVRARFFFFFQIL